MVFRDSKINFIENFLSHFQSTFSKKQWHSFRSLVYSMFFDYKRLSLAALANKSSVHYQNLQYFASESKWSTENINNIRLALIQNQRTTRSTPDGVLAIDDTACPKPYSKNTEGAQFQHCNPTKKEENCNVAVASCFVSSSKHFPVNFKSYIPEDQYQYPEDFKSKLDFAKDLIIDAMDKNISFSSVVFDSWYTASNLIEFISSKNLSLVAEVKMNRSIRIVHPQTKTWIYLQAKNLIPVIKEFYSHKLKNVHCKQKNGKDKNLLTYSFETKIKDCFTPLKVVFVFNKWSDKDDKDVHVLITNKISMSTRDIIFTYLLRWGIEESFKELKDTFCFDQYQVRHQKQIQRHWIMSFLAWSLAYWVKQNGCLSKILDDKPGSINKTKEAISSLIIIDSACLLSKNKELAASHFSIKSKNFLNKLKS